MKPIAPQQVGTLLGMLSITFWSTTIAFSRILTEALGPLTAASYVYSISGAIGCAYLIAKPDGIGQLRRTPIPYLYGCGALFVMYSVCLYLAVGFAAGRQQVLEVGIINYLWPSLTLVFSIPILHKRARIFLFPGMMIALAGVFLATIQRGPFSWETLKENVRLNFFPYILAFVASICWGLYSNLSRRWGGATQSGAIPVFLLSTGVVLIGVKSISAETTRWTSQAVLALAYMAIFPTLLAYGFWDIAMRKGRIILVASLSYLTPLLSTLVSSLYLQIQINLTLWVACILVIAGAIICNLSIFE